jgi:hypothetical protein
MYQPFIPDKNSSPTLSGGSAVVAINQQSVSIGNQSAQSAINQQSISGNQRNQQSISAISGNHFPTQDLIA